MTYNMKILLDDRMDPLYRATIEATEEAIINALVAGRTMTGRSGHVAPGLPHDQVRDLMARWSP